MHICQKQSQSYRLFQNFTELIQMHTYMWKKQRVLNWMKSPDLFPLTKPALCINTPLGKTRMRNVDEGIPSSRVVCFLKVSRPHAVTMPSHSFLVLSIFLLISDTGLHNRPINYIQAGDVNKVLFNGGATPGNHP